jgi:hypothetical protein
LARRRPPTGRKRRTREHVIADLGVNHVERAVLLCGYTVQEQKHDYGIDQVIETFDRRGEKEFGQLRLQVKSTDGLARMTAGEVVTWRVVVSDLRSWLFDLVPVILVVYDAKRDVAYWLDLQEYAHHLDPPLDLSARTVSVHIPVANVWTPAAVRRLRQVKNRLVARQQPRFPDNA